MLSEKEIGFIIENGNADTGKLLLGASKYPGINVKLCVNCIESRQKIASKLPNWHANTALVYPFPLSAEQCSSEATGEYKKKLVSGLLSRIEKSKNTSEPTDNTGDITGADLTGGMGVDSSFLAQVCSSFHYFERNSELCNATEYNFRKLGAGNIAVHNIEIESGNISRLPGAPFCFIFIDPARRSKGNKDSKVISLQDYDPNIIELKEELFKTAPAILVKVSPMADIKLNLSLLPETSEIHIVSVDNECKELLFLLERANSQEHNQPYTLQNAEPVITAVNLSSKGREPQYFRYKLSQEESASAHYCSEIRKYLYEPNKSLLKGGAFKLLGQRYNIEKLAPSTHLYTSEKPIEEFPGKIYEIEEVIPFNKKTIKQIAAKYPKADITARNFPLDTNALKKLSGIKDGGNHHIFATTLGNGEKIVAIASIRK